MPIFAENHLEMKKYLLIGLLAFSACTRDASSVQQVYPASLVGKWTNDVKTNRKPTFTRDSVWWDGIWPYGYKVSHDTFYAYAFKGDPYPDPEFTFWFSNNNSAVTIHPVVGEGDIIYYRVKVD